MTAAKAGKEVDCFDSLGYNKLAEDFNIELVDFNATRTITKKNPDFLGHAEIQFPKIIEKTYVISVATLKEHSMAAVTLSLKNMFGLYPGKLYGGEGFGRSWKSKVHNFGVNNSIVDINLCKSPDLSIIDGRVGMLGNHLTGKTKNFNVIIAGYDPVALDTVGAEMSGHDRVTHISMCEQEGIDLRKPELFRI